MVAGGDQKEVLDWGARQDSGGRWPSQAGQTSIVQLTLAASAVAHRGSILPSRCCASCSAWNRSFSCGCSLPGCDGHRCGALSTPHERIRETGCACPGEKAKVGQAAPLWQSPVDRIGPDFPYSRGRKLSSFQPFGSATRKTGSILHPAGRSSQPVFSLLARSIVSARMRRRDLLPSDYHVSGLGSLLCVLAAIANRPIQMGRATCLDCE